MIDVRLYSFLILSVFMTLLLLGYVLIFVLRPKTESVSSPLRVFVYFLILSFFLGLFLAFILIFVRSKIFYKPVQMRLSRMFDMENKNNLTPAVPPVPVPNSPSVPSSPFAPSSPLAPPSPPMSMASEKPPTTSYYAYNPSTQTLEWIDLDKVTLGKQILDTFHRNDESIFVLDDGIITILGDEINRYTQGLPIKKVRVLKNEYVGLANGKIYKSKDLANWVVDSSKPTNILDMDVPFNQDQILFIQTPNENLWIDANTNQVVNKESSEVRKYGSDLNNFLRKTNDGVYIVKDGMQSLFRGYGFGDVSNQNRFLVVPNQIKEGYKVIDSMNLDDKLLVKVETLTDKPERMIQTRDLIYQ